MKFIYKINFIKLTLLILFPLALFFVLPNVSDARHGQDDLCANRGGTCSFNCPTGTTPQSGLCHSNPAENFQCCIKSGSTGPGGTFGSGSTFRSGGGQTITIPNPLGATSFEELIVRLNRWLLVIAAPILTLMIVIGAFQILTAAGNPENITKGRHTITYAVIGYALLLLSSGIVFIIRQVLGVQ